MKSLIPVVLVLALGCTSSVSQVGQQQHACRATCFDAVSLGGAPCDDKEDRYADLLSCMADNCAAECHDELLAGEPTHGPDGQPVGQCVRCALDPCGPASGNPDDDLWDRCLNY